MKVKLLAKPISQPAFYLSMPPQNSSSLSAIMSLFVSHCQQTTVETTSFSEVVDFLLASVPPKYSRKLFLSIPSCSCLQHSRLCAPKSCRCTRKPECETPASHSCHFRGQERQSTGCTPTGGNGSGVIPQATRV